jgi:DNA-binding CsgD family transcriptional regulator
VSSAAGWGSAAAPVAAAGSEHALDLAHRAGATALASRAHHELLATGARPRRRSLAGPDALTASEQRVARLAADGLTNRQIAQALYITEHTVATHLHRSYQKLNIQSRAELAAALAD